VRSRLDSAWVEMPQALLQGEKQRDFVDAFVLDHLTFRSARLGAVGLSNFSTSSRRLGPATVLVLKFASLECEPKACCCGPSCKAASNIMQDAARRTPARTTVHNPRLLCWRLAHHCWRTGTGGKRGAAGAVGRWLLTQRRTAQCCAPATGNARASCCHRGLWAGRRRGLL
jgi:hypothetical protein